MTYTQLRAGIEEKRLFELEAKRRHFVSERDRGHHVDLIFPSVVWKHDKRQRMLKKRRLRGYVKVADLFQSGKDILDGFNPAEAQLLVEIHPDAYLWVGVCG